MNKEKVFARFTETRQNLLKALSGLSAEDLIRKPVEGTWTAQDLLAHVTAWEVACLEPLRAYAAGGEFKPEDIPNDLAWNDIQEAIWRQKSLDQILAEFHQSRQELVELLNRLPDSALEQEIFMPWGETGSVIKMISGLAWHENEHTESILHAAGTGPAHE